MADRAGKLAEFRHDGGQLLGPIASRLGVEPDVAAVLDDLDAVAVPFCLVHPLVAFRRGFAGDCEAGRMKARRWDTGCCLVVLVRQLKCDAAAPWMRQFK